MKSILLARLSRKNAESDGIEILLEFLRKWASGSKDGDQLLPELTLFSQFCITLHHTILY